MAPHDGTLTRNTSMPLLDHFRPPLRERRHWESFYATGSVAIMRALNRDLLPPGYFAEVQAHVGSRVEIDVATFEGLPGGPGTADAASGGGGVTATLPARVWAPPAPDWEMPAVFPDSVEGWCTIAEPARRWWPRWSWSAPATRTAPRPAGPLRPSVPVTSSKGLGS